MDKTLIENRKNMIYEFISDKKYSPMKLKELASLFNVPKPEREEFKEIVDMLISDGKVMTDDQGRVRKVSADTLSGIFSGTTRGFGFVSIEGETEDIFIAADDTNTAHDKDRVLIKIKPGSRGRSREGVVINVLERSSDTIVGTFERTKTYGFVIPDNHKFGQDIYIPHGFTKGAVTGHKVEVELTSYGGSGKQPEGHIVSILGHINDPTTDIVGIIRAYGIPLEFPEGVLSQITSIPSVADPADFEGRLDLRDVQMVTIDGEDAKDLDDAVSLTYDGIYHLGVHIADVSHYVREGSPLDKEALKRGTSNYLVDSVIPMLPHELSNGICSLNEGQDRLALSCLMDIDEKGIVVGHRIAETVIRVDRRMSYTSVKKILEDGDPEETSKYETLVPMFKLMADLAGKLRSKRMKRGSIDFDIPECKILVNEKCVPYDIVPYDRNTATRIIEDFMLIANETVAEDYFWQELPFVYRTHETPDPEKILKLGIFINNFGYAIKTGQDEIHPKELQKLLAKIQGTEEETLISRLTLRSMKQARYSTECNGHFGLAAKYYCHFTSPIRRYPDLQIHRIIKENLHGRLGESRINHYNNILPDVADKCSKTERRADEAEREVEKLKKIEFMEPHLGEYFDGVISGVSSWGMFVELPSTVEGTIEIAALTGDYYYFDESHYMLVGEHTNKLYKLGDRIKVQLVKADKLTRSIEFLPAEAEAAEDEE